MADVSQIKVNNITYNIKDATIRNSPAFTGSPTAPTPATSSNTTRIATTAYVQKHAPIYLHDSIPAGSTATFSHSEITSTMRIVDCRFGLPNNVLSNVTWVTSTGSITFSGTFSGATNVYYILVECN